MLVASMHCKQDQTSGSGLPPNAVKKPYSDVEAAAKRIRRGTSGKTLLIAHAQTIKAGIRKIPLPPSA